MHFLMDTWGPRAWKQMHDASLTSSSIEFIELLDQLDKDIPCARCQKHFREYRQAHPVSAKTNLVTWAIKFHNSVNATINKRVLPMREALAMVKGDGAPDPTFIGAVLLLAVAIIF